MRFLADTVRTLIAALVLFALLVLGLSALITPVRRLDDFNLANVKDGADASATLIFAAAGGHVVARLRRPRYSFGWAVVSGLLTGIFGGALRDLSSFTEPVLCASIWMVPLALTASLVGALLGRTRSERTSAIFRYLEYLAVAVTCVICVDKAGALLVSSGLPLPPMKAVIPVAQLKAFLTCCGGGLTRDYLVLRRRPSAFATSYWLLPLVGALAHILLVSLVSFWLGDAAFDPWPLSIVLIFSAAVISNS